MKQSYYNRPIGAYEGDDYPKPPLSEPEMQKIVDESNNAYVVIFIKATLAIQGLRPEVRHHLEQALTIQRL